MKARKRTEAPSPAPDPLAQAHSQLIRYASDLQRLLREKRQWQAESRRAGIAKPAVRHRPAPPPEGRTRFIGDSPAMQRVIDLCHRVARSKATVLLTGATGTGKEVAATYIHDCSKRCDGPFVAVNCAALPETLVESELFGHEKGAFTDATRQKPGQFEQACGGTIFLDEIGELPMPVQAKLLRALELREFRRVGGNATLKLDARIVAATNRDLEAEVAAGRFREDLYYRLNVLHVRLPGLAERLTDIPQLVAHFVTEAAATHDIDPPAISDEIMRLLKAHHWHGNVRELRNVIERCVVLCESGTITPSHLPTAMRHAAATAPDAETGLPSMSELAQVERSLVVQALEENDWNKAAAARQLGISWDNLRYRIKKYGLTPGE